MPLIQFISIVMIAAVFCGAALGAAPKDKTLKAAPIVLAGNQKKLIFLDFYNESHDKNLQYIANSIGDAVHDSIKEKYRYDRIPSAAWKKYATDNKWEEKDFYDRKKSARWAARWVLTV